MKTYKIAPLGMDATKKGLESWLSKASGKKNAFRIEREHGSKENLLSVISFQARLENQCRLHQTRSLAA